ncbi:MAG TPA: hypothetical protein G4O02_03300 [Caldilineae bacterium]|nr:hypothetical protein [Caldilineae bacterium]
MPIFDEGVLHLAQDAAGRLYAVEARNGLFRLDHRGRWERIREEPRALTVDVSPDGSLILLGTAGHGLWISWDHGDHWRQVSEFEGEYIAALLVDQETGQRACVGTSTHVYCSEDAGRTWRLASSLDKRAYSFVMTPDGALYAGLEGAVARSEDYGQTWVLSGEGLPRDAIVLGLAIVEEASGKSMLYAATRGGVYRSTDQGKTWQRCGRGPGRVVVRALAGDERIGLVAATPLGLYRRAPAGEAWLPTARELGYRHFYALARDGATYTIYAGTESGLSRSTDGGRTWEEASSTPTPRGIVGLLTDPAAPHHLFARLAFERVYESQDEGQTWEARWDGMEVHHVVLSMARSPSGELFAGTQDGLFQWDPKEKRWQREPLPFSDESVFAIAFSPDGTSRYLGTTRGIWTDANGGRWHRCAPEVIKDTVTSLVILPDGRIYAGTMYAGLYQSCDQGMTWYRISGIPADATVNDLLIDPVEGRIYVATDRGLFRGPDAECPLREAPLRMGRRARMDSWTALMRSFSRSLPYPQIRLLPAAHTLRPDDTLLREAQEIGFQAIVQVFPWQEIEPLPGDWYWEYPDFLVQAADYYGLDLIVRLDHPPTWAREDGDFPFNVEAYLKFVGTVARRYQGRIRAYIIWNEPNLASEWGAPPDPSAYTRLLQLAYQAIKREDPLALVVSAGLAPTNEQSDQAMDDRVFLEGMYQAGARPFFDALGAHPYGFAYPPDDSHGAHEGLNMSRILDLRAVMAAHGDGAKPIWATEIGWTTHGVGEHAWLTVTLEEQADYLARAWWKAYHEWPWLRVFTVWNLSRGAPEEDEKFGYSLLFRDGRPKPVCQALRDTFASIVSRRYSIPDPWWMLLETLGFDSSPIHVLARDIEIHLGDNE